MALLTSGWARFRGRSYCATHHSGTVNSRRSMATGLREIPRLEIQQVELRGVRIFQARESRIEVPDRQAQVASGTGVSDREIQVAIAGKIDAMIRGVLASQHIGVAATRARRFLGKPAFEVKARLIHPVRLGQRRVGGCRQEIGCAPARWCRRGVEAQPAFGEKAVRDDGNHGQQDADSKAADWLDFFSVNSTIARPCLRFVLRETAVPRSLSAAADRY